MVQKQCLASGAFVAQTFLSAVSPTFLSADFDQYTFVRAKAESKQAESPAIRQTEMSALR
jgi:hypothetical protein